MEIIWRVISWGGRGEWEEGTEIKKQNRYVQNRQGDVKKSIGNV